MDRTNYQKIMSGSGQLDYEIYLKTERLLACQKEPEDLCNPEELQFMIVQHVKELWMKLMATKRLNAKRLSRNRLSADLLSIREEISLG